MKASKLPTPEQCSDAPAATPQTMLARDRSDTWARSYLRLATFNWEPPSMSDAKQMGLECVWRAQAVANVVAKGVGQGDVTDAEIQNRLELIDDLLHIIPMLDWWSDEEQLLADGWTPPPGKEVRP